MPTQILMFAGWKGVQSSLDIRAVSSWSSTNQPYGVRMGKKKAHCPFLAHHLNFPVRPWVKGHFWNLSYLIFLRGTFHKRARGSHKTEPFLSSKDGLDPLLSCSYKISTWDLRKHCDLKSLWKYTIKDTVGSLIDRWRVWFINKREEYGSLDTSTLDYL